MSDIQTTMDQNALTESEKLAKEYDEVPYVSYPFEFCAPEFLRTKAILFGLNPVPLETARVLEMGCASGNNLFRFSSLYPDSYTLGIDISKVEVDHAHELLGNFKLKNIEFKNVSITDLDESYGKFDYIICHGLYSWVPDEVAEKILENGKKLLSKNGVMLVSYNALPAWNTISTIRQLMLYHTQHLSSPAEKFEQGKLILQFIAEATAGDNSPYGKFIQEFIGTLATVGDDYIWHEYFGALSKPYYFHEFVEKARSYELNYLCDQSFSFMHAGNLPPKTVEALGTIPDTVKVIQYLDFIRNTQFKINLLCHDDVVINRTLDTNKLDNMYFSATDLQPSDAENQNTYLTQELVDFRFTAGTNVKVTLPEQKALMYTLAENVANPLRINQIEAIVTKKLANANLVTDMVKSALVDLISRLLLADALYIFADKPKTSFEISEKPKSTSLYNGLENAKEQLWIHSGLNAPLMFDEVMAKVVPLIDGTRTIEEITQELVKQFESGQLSVMTNGQKKAYDDYYDIAKTTLLSTLEYLRKNYGLAS